MEGGSFNSVGFSLAIDEGLINRMAKADKLIKDIGTHSEQTRDKLVTAFRGMGDDGVGYLISKLQEVQNKMSAINGGKISIDTNTIDQSISKTNTNVDELAEGIKNLEVYLRSLSKREPINLIGNTKDTTLLSLQDKYDSQMNRLFEYKQHLRDLQLEQNKSLKSGVFREGLGEDMKNAIRRTEELMNSMRTLHSVISGLSGSNTQFIEMANNIGKTSNELKSLKAYYSELEKASDIAKLDNSSATSSIEEAKQRYNELYSIYEKAFDKYEAKIKEQAQIDNQRAKESSLAYQQSYEERVRMYEKMLNNIYAKEEEQIRLSNQRAKENSFAYQQGFNERYKVWKEHFDKIAKEEEEQIRLSNQRAKENSIAYQQGFDERYKAWKQHFDKIEQQEQEAKRSTYSGALDYSKSTKSVEEQIKAIKYLDKARKSLSREGLSEGEYYSRIQALTNEINRQKKSVNELTGAYASLGRNKRNLLNLSEQLMRRLALVFSVSQVTGYINKLIEVRGEFELQQRSLEAIIQNKDESNKLWNQTVQLAITSPFRIKELVTYTKQLAAYRIETDKLYKTNKMLADISAGLGVDMNRLILAFGQVKAANYLRGTELRQFSEAGVNILGELATYFSEIENRAVSVGEVFNMVSKRMVSFADVEKVLQRLTSEGNPFFRMQEIQSETMKGMWSNLMDSIDVMLNDIGKSSEGVIKYLLNLFKSLIDNWKVFADILKGSLALFAVYKINAWESTLVDFAKQMKLVGEDTKTLNFVELLQVSLAKLSKGFKAATAAAKSFIASNWILLAIAGVIGAIREIVLWNSEYNDKIEELNRKREEEISSLNKVAEEYKTLMQLEKDEADISDDLFNKKLSKLKEFQKSVGLTSLEIPIEFGEVTKENIDKIFAQTEEMATYAQDFGFELGKNIAKGLTGKQGGLLWVHWLGDNLKTDLDALEGTLEEITGAAQNRLQVLMNEIGSSYNNLSDNAKDYYRVLKEGRNETETTYDWYKRQVTMLNMIAKEFKFRNNDILKDANSLLYNIKRNEEEVFYELDKVIRRQLKDYGVKDFANLPKEQQIMMKIQIDKAFERLELSASAQRIAAFFTAQSFKIPYRLIPAKSEDKGLPDWAKRYNEYIKTLNSNAVKEVTNIETTVDSLLSELNTYIKGEEGIINKAKAGSKAYTDEEVRNAKKRLDALKSARSWLQGDDVDNKGNKQENVLNKRISLIKEMNKAYLELAKTFDGVTAKEKVMASYGDTFKDAFKGTNISSIDFTSQQGVKDALNMLVMPIAISGGKESILQLKKEISSIDAQIGVNIKQGSDKELVNRIQDMIDSYKFYLEIDKLNIPQSLAKDLFNIETTSLETIKGYLSSQQEQFVGEDMVKEYDKLWKTILDMENNAQMERLKNYSKYLTNATSQFVQLKLKAFDEISEIKKTFTLTQPVAERDFGINTLQWGMLNDIMKETQKSFSELSDEEYRSVGISDKYISKIREYLLLMDEQSRKAIAGVKRDSNAKLQQQQWKDFKSSDMYVLMFEDIENIGTKSLEALKKRLDDLKSSLSNLPANQVKEIVKQINSIDDQLISRNPLSETIRLAKEIKNYPSLEDLQIQLINAEKEKEEAQNIINIIDEVTSAEKKGNIQLVDETTIGQYNKIVALAEQEGKNVSDVRKDKKKIVGDQEKIISYATEGITINAKYNKALQVQSDWWGAINDKINGVFDNLKGLMGILGEDADSTNMAIIDITQNMFSLVAATLQMSLAMKAAGVAANSALGVIGWIAIVLQSVVSLFSSLFGAKDKALQKQIEDLQENVKALEWSLNNLNKAFDDVFNISDMERYTREMRTNLNAQIKSYQMMIKAERDKKSTDEAQIREWQRTIGDLQQQLLDVEKDAFNKATADILDNTLSAAEEFTDAWLNAFKETGSGLSGLEENFKEATLNMVKQQASLFITGTYVDRWKKNLEQYINASDLELTTQEANAWMKSVQTELPLLNDALEKYFNAMKQAGVDIYNTSSDLSGLQRGIQGITETQADEIAAYLNTLRFLVSNSVDLLTSFYNIFSNDTMANPMLAELRTQTGLIRTIKDMLGSVIGRGNSTHNGAYLKVAL